MAEEPAVRVGGAPVSVIRHAELLLRVLPRPQADGCLAILGRSERPGRKFPVPFSGGPRPIRRHARQERQPTRRIMASRPGNMPPKSARRCSPLARRGKGGSAQRLHRELFDIESGVDEHRPRRSSHGEPPPTRGSGCARRIVPRRGDAPGRGVPLGSAGIPFIHKIDLYCQ